MKVCGDPDFSIDEWNKAYKFCEDAGIEGIERDKILYPEMFPCAEQCESCTNVVLDTNLKYAKKKQTRTVKKSNPKEWVSIHVDEL